MMIVECRQLGRTYGAGRAAQVALTDVSLQFERGEICSILGPSGSGKTTLLSILGCLLAPTRGELWVENVRVDHARPRQLVRLRRRLIGFVFQQARLLPFLSIEENLRLVGRNSGLPRQDLSRRIDRLLDELSLADVRNRSPDEASVGERQRASIARAILHRPPIVLADEPTASLDWPTGRRVMELLIQQAREEKALLIIVTHDPRAAALTHRSICIDSGKVLDA